MIETWVNIIETLICIHIIQKIKEIIPEKEKEGKEEQKEDKNTLGYMSNIISFPDLSSSIEGSKESMSESYEILEHKYYEKMQQLVVKLKEEQTQLQFHLGSTQDPYEFKLDIDLEATQYKMPITQESLLSLNDIFTKTKRFMKGDKKTWKENVTEFINKHFMNDLVDDIVTKSHYNSSNVMSIIQDQIPQLRFLDNTNMKENFFSTIVEQEGKQYDDKTKTEFTKYYHHFFLENLNGKINNKPINTPEGLKELQNLLKEFQKLRDPEFYAEEKEETGEKEMLEKIDMTYEPNLNLMRDFVKGNMKTKFEAYVKPNIEIKKEVVELEGKTIEEKIEIIEEKLEQQKEQIIKKQNNNEEEFEKLKKYNEELKEKIQKLQNQEENNKKSMEIVEESLKYLKENYNKELEKNEDVTNKLNKLNEEIKRVKNIKNLKDDDFNKLFSNMMILYSQIENDKQTNDKEFNELLKKITEKEKIISQLKTNIEETNVEHENKIKEIDENKTADNETKIIELEKKHKEKITQIETRLIELIETNEKLNNTIESRDKQIVELQESIANLKGLTDTQRNKIETMENDYKTNVEKLKTDYAKGLETEKERNIKSLNVAADSLEQDNILLKNTYEKELQTLQEKYTTELNVFKKEIENLNSDKDNLQNQNKDLSTKQSELEKQIEKKTNEKTNLEIQLTSTQNKLDASQQEQNRLQINIKKQEAELEAKIKQEAELEAKIKELETENDELKQANTQNQEQIENQQEEIATQDEIIINLRKQLDDKKKQITSKIEEIHAFTESINLLRTKIGNQEKEISELEELIAKLTSKKEQVEADLNSIRAKEEKEKERIRQEEEAQKQKEEEERIRKAEEKKSKETDKRRKKEEELKRLHELVLNKEKIDALDSIINLEKNIKALLEFDTSKLTIINVTREVSYLKDKQNYKKLIEFINKMRNIIKGNEIITQDILETADTYYGFEEDTKTPSTYLIQNNKQFQFKILNDIWSNIHERIEYVSKNISKNGSNSSFLEIIINLKENFNNMNSTVLDYLQRSVAINNPEENAGLKYNKKSPIIVLSTEEIKNPNQIEPNSQNITKENIIELINLNQNQYLFDKKMYKNGNGYEFKPNNFNKFITDIINQYANNNKCLNPKQNSKKEDKEKQALELIIESRRDTRNKKNSCSKSDEINEIVKHFNSIFYTNRNNWLQSNNQEIPDTVSYDKKTPQAKNNQNASTELVSMSNTGVTDIKPNNLNNDLAKENYMTPEKTQQNGGKKKTRRKGRTKKKTKTRKK